MRLASLRLPFHFVALGLAGMLCLQGCEDGPRAPTWGAQPLPVAARVDSPSAEALRASDIAPLSVYRPRSLLNIPAGDWGDSLALVEFGDEITAYAAFQEIAVTPEDPSAGTTVRGARVCFRRGRWVGSLPAWAWKGASWYDSMLALPGGAPVGQLPEAFESMLHQDRVPGSERVLASQVLGGAIEAPALAVALDCDGDTAWIYAAMAKRAALGPLKILGWRSASGDEDLFFRENPDLPPASLRFSTRGAVAVEGCFDPDKVNSWLKSQYAGLKSIEKSLNTLKSLSFD